jgi:hypothetical protein
VGSVSDMHPHDPMHKSGVICVDVSHRVTTRKHGTREYGTLVVLLFFGFLRRQCLYGHGEACRDQSSMLVQVPGMPCPLKSVPLGNARHNTSTVVMSGNVSGGDI